jgi:hypothetical protein
MLSAVSRQPAKMGEGKLGCLAGLTFAPIGSGWKIENERSGGQQHFSKSYSQRAQKNPPLPAGGYFSVEEASTFIVI